MFIIFIIICSIANIISKMIYKLSIVHQYDVALNGTQNWVK